mgnify:CR=1 FL=1
MYAVIETGGYRGTAVAVGQGHVDSFATVGVGVDPRGPVRRHADRFLKGAGAKVAYDGRWGQVHEASAFPSVHHYRDVFG